MTGPAVALPHPPSWPPSPGRGASSSSPTWTTKAFVLHTMGTAISVHLRATLRDHDARAERLADAVERAFTVLRRADAVFSPYRVDSDLMRLRHGRMREADADPWLTEVRHLCEEATAVTGGLFTTDLVGPDGSRGFDPTGLVKGWALERAADVLRQIEGIVFCLNGGGDIVIGEGPHTDARVDRLWRVGIADPRGSRRGATTDVIELRAGALATSGTGERGAHIIDPRQGAPARSPFTSVTVTGPDLVWADVWATAVFVDPDALAFNRMAASYAVRATT